MRSTLRRAAAPALDALRTYWGTTLLLVVACAAGLAVMLPVAALARWGPGGLAPTIALQPVRQAQLGVAWGAFAETPSQIRQAAVAALVRLLLGMAVGVLAVTWFTTLSVSTARADARASEIAARRAVGASRRHLFGAALIEGALTAALALVVGGASGIAAARIALGAWPGTMTPAFLPFGPIVVAATLSGVVLGALFPLIFARRSSRIAVTESSAVGLAVPAAQLGLCLTVLVAASLVNGSAARLTTGASAAGLNRGEVFQITMRGAGPPSGGAGYAVLLRRLKADPGVETASVTTPGALAGLGVADVVWADFARCASGFAALPMGACFATHYVVSPDTFRALGLRVLAGRPLAEQDDVRAPRVAVVSASLARWGASSALGKTVFVGSGRPVGYTVVGVVDDRRPLGIGNALEPAAAVYLSVFQHHPAAVDLILQGRVSSATIGVLRGALDDGFGAGSYRVRRVSEAALLSAETAPLRWFAQMFRGEGISLLVIATVGTFAMMWLWVSSLLCELGIRRAVGARRRWVLGHVLSRALLVAVGGVAIGTWAGMMVWDALASVVPSLPAWDSGLVLRYGVLLGVAALAGALYPAWRAARSAPIALLET